MRQSGIGACICAFVFGASLGMATGTLRWAITGAIGVLCLYAILFLLTTDPEWSNDDDEDGL